MTIGSVNGRAVIGGDLLVKNVSYKDTPVTITSWSYVTTTITLNVASHTFVAGDYIEVGGLTATTNIPNGVHLVTSVTATTIVFTYALTPTGTAGVSSATVKGYMTTNGRVEGIGVGKVREDVTGSRVLGTIYQNTSGEPKYISAWSLTGSTTGGYWALTVNGVIVAVSNQSYTANAIVSIAHIIMPNESYSISVGAAAAPLTKWFEYRA